MKFKKIILIIVLFIFILIAFSFLDIYVVKSDLFLGGFFSKIIPLPAVYSNGSFITMNKYEDFLNDYRIYFLFDKNANVNQYSNLAVKQLVGLKFVEEMNKKFHVNCGKDSEYVKFKDNFYAQNNINENVIKNLKTNLGFKENKFEEYVIFPSFCRMKISGKLLDSDYNKIQRIKIDQIYSDIVKNPDKFTEYSDKYNDKSIDKIKKIGWLSKEDLPESLSVIIDNMKVGDISPVFQSVSGFHIYKIEAIVSDEKNNKFYEFSQVYLPTKNLNDYIQEYLTNGKFRILVP